MAEQIFKSPGVATREIDLTGPRRSSPSGVPAGIIGTALRGPAFVPVTVGTMADFNSIFGSDYAGTNQWPMYGPVAMNEWLRNARAATYIRVLGTGDGKKRLTSAGYNSDAEAIPAGGVKNAGFIVGSRPVKDNGYLGNNFFARHGDIEGGTVKGRTYFLAAFMSDSAGSTYLQDSGLQKGTNTVASTTFVFATKPTTDTELTLKDADGNQVTFVIKNGVDTATGVLTDGKVIVGTSDVGNAAQMAARFNTIIALLDGGGEPARGLLNMKAWHRIGTGVIQLTQTTAGNRGNQSVKGMNSNWDNVILQPLSGGMRGAERAAPIIRGVMMFPSGVVPGLSSSAWNSPASASLYGYDLAKISAGKRNDGYGWNAGGELGDINVNLSDYTFTMFLNGFDGGTTGAPTLITASLDPTNTSNYISEVFNTDPLKISEKGHYLHAWWDVSPQQAVVTSSQITNLRVTGSKGWRGYEPAVMLMTSSITRNTETAAIPNFENFSDRYSAPESPWVISQAFGGKYKNLFKIYSLDDGDYASNNFKISISNVRNSDIQGDYGSFDLAVRRYDDTDAAPVILDDGAQLFAGLNLDPSSPDYIARRIGDINTYFDWDHTTSGQRLVVDGMYANNSSYIRVKVSDEIENGTMEKVAVPCGFRGYKHLVTSGSSIINSNQFPYGNAHDSAESGDNEGRFPGSIITSSDDYGSRIIQPPVPMRQNIRTGEAGTLKLVPSLYWGTQFTSVDSVTDPNKSTKRTDLRGFSKYFPDFSTSGQKAWVGDNSGVVDSSGTVYDADRFNNNLFNLEKIQILTKSSGDIVDPTQWVGFEYRRNGVLAPSIKDVNEESQTETRFLNASKDFGLNGRSKNFLKFTFFMQGGFNGADIFNLDKKQFRDVATKREMDDEAQGLKQGPTVSAFLKAVDIMSEKSDTDIQILAIPGIRESLITDHAMVKTEERFDALYIMDIEEKDTENNIMTSSLQNQSATYTAEMFNSRNLNSSFAAAYWPDVTIRRFWDAGATDDVPPSCAVLGALSLNDRVAYPWFAPAGFTRGALSTVTKVGVNLMRSNLDTLYDADINPITSFPDADGPIVFGQKTLLKTASALDRVNVRRLLIDIRRKVKRVAMNFLFEPNREATLARFSADVNPILNTIQQLQGLDRYKVVIDTTTTTQADIENNTIRGKIFLQPTRAVEFISLDFVITNNGVEGIG